VEEFESEEEFEGRDCFICLSKRVTILHDLARFIGVMDSYNILSCLLTDLLHIDKRSYLRKDQAHYVTLTNLENTGAWKGLTIVFFILSNTSIVLAAQRKDHAAFRCDLKRSSTSPHSPATA
jgi:hypothetical protein